MTPKYYPKNDPPKWPFNKNPPCFMHTELKTVLISKSSDIWSEWKLICCLQNWCDSPNKFEIWISQLLEKIIHQNRWEVGQSLRFEDDIKTFTSWRIKKTSRRDDFITQDSILSSRDSYAISGTTGTAMFLEIWPILKYIYANLNT